MKEMWDERYAADEYAYGTSPNKYFAEKLKGLEPGNILLPAEGEGRNAVYAAELGWKVTAFDISSEGRRKALKLAQEKGVEIDYLLLGFQDIDFEKESFDCLGLIYAHLPSPMRLKIYPQLYSYVKKGGSIILEGFSEKQLGLNSGGPKELDFLFTTEKLKQSFPSFSQSSFVEAQIELNEGSYHQGKAEVIQLFGVK